MAKEKKSMFRCTECGETQPRWAGKCSACGSWNTVVEVSPGVNNSFRNSQDRIELSLLSGVEMEDSRRVPSGLSEVDRVLGGGIVPGSFMLIGGEPGVGKSTLVLEMARRYKGRFYYFSGEESASQIKMRASRMEIHSDTIYLSNETDLERICALLENDKPDFAVMDSIQTAFIPGLDSSPGSVVQLREAAHRLMEVSKKTRVPVLVTGHITREGTIAGPRLLEHMVDTVLYFESDRLNHYRILRATKNRFGPVGEAAIFEMTRSGLSEVSDLKIARMEKPVPGRMFSSFVEGTRALAVEVQALVTRTLYGPGKRMAEGMDSRRLILLAAVMEKFLKLSLSDSDIFVNLAGGLNANDPALDLAVCSAILSSAREQPGRESTAFIGEIGLSGEIRPVGNLSARIRALSGLGFARIFVPAAGAKEAAFDGVELIFVEHISELLAEKYPEEDFTLEGSF